MYHWLGQEMWLTRVRVAGGETLRGFAASLAWPTYGSTVDGPTVIARS